MHRRSVLWLGLMLGLPAVLPAQESPSGSVSGEGTATIERPASRLRLTIELTEKGPTTKEALAKLGERKQAARLLLATLGAEKQSVKFAKPALALEDSQQRQQLEAMLQERLARGASVPKGLQVPKSVTVNCQLTAEWPLSGKSSEDLLVEAKELQDKIAAADLAGLKEPKKLSPEEAELEEELAALAQERYYDDTEAKPGEPKFVYLAKISEDELAEAMKEAFEKAKVKAARLARAAGAELGGLANLKRIDSGIGDYGAYDYYAYRDLPIGENTDDTESRSATPGTVKFEFAIEATFRLSTP